MFTLVARLTVRSFESSRYATRAGFTLCLYAVGERGGVCEGGVGGGGSGERDAGEGDGVGRPLGDTLVAHVDVNRKRLDVGSRWRAGS